MPIMGAVSRSTLRHPAAPAWGFLLVGLLLVGATRSVAGTALATGLWVGSFLAAGAAIGVGRRLHRPRQTAELSWFAAALLCGGAGYALSAGTVLPTLRSAATILILASYLLAAVAVGMGSWQRGYRGADMVLEGAIVALAAAVVGWTLVLGPALAASDLSLAEQAPALLRPALGVLLLAAVLPMSLRRRTPRVTEALVGLGLATLLVADVWQAELLLGGAYAPGHPVDGVRQVFTALVGAAALHPTMRAWSEPVVSGGHGLSLPGTVLLGAALLVPPAVGAGTALGVSSLPPATAVALVVLQTLVLVRLVRALRGSGRLVEELARANAGLDLGEQRFRSLFERSPQIIYAQDLSGHFTEVNPATCAFLGLRKEELLGRSFREVILPDGVEAAEAAFTAVATGEPVTLELPVLARRGRRLLSIQGVPMLVDGRLAGIYGIGVDITEQRRAEEALARRSAQQEVVVRFGRDALVATGIDDLLERAVGAVRQALGFVGCTVHERTPGGLRLRAGWQGPDTEEGVALHLAVPIDVGPTAWGTLLVTPDGGRELDEDERRFLEMIAVTIAHGIEHQRRVSELSALVGRHELALEVGHQWIWEIDGATERVTVFPTPAYEELHAVLPDFDDTDRRGWDRVIHPADLAGWGEWAAQLQAGEDVEPFDLRLVTRDDGVRWLRVAAAPLQSSAGDVGVVMGVCQDVTTQHEAEDRLRQAEQLEAIGRLAGGVAHDFNNLLSAIGGYAELVTAAVPGSSPEARALEEILLATGRGASLVDQLLSFSRRKSVEKDVIAVVGALSSVEDLLRRLTGDHIVVVGDYDADTPNVRLPGGQLEQVLINLAVNARDAMPDGGTLTLRSRARRLPQPVDGLPAGHFAELVVEDDGCGMEASVAGRAFEPFFTTKEEGKGTGLGLASTYGIVTDAGGRVSIDSAPGRGTQVRVLLPAALRVLAGVQPPPDRSSLRSPVETAAPEVRPALARPPSQDGTTVLVVEDQEQLRRLFTAALERAGHRVVAAADGAEAAALHAEGLRPDLLLTDVVMPRMSGPALAEAVRAEQPALRVLYMSGYVAGGVLPEGALRAADAFLQKPFGLTELTAAVAQALERTPVPG
jgi:two-component system, cell cycle sensor histidine kinase and response regulator CckA